MKSKEAKRRKQVKAQQRKRKLAEKQKTKKLARKPSTAALYALVDRWMKLDPSVLPVQAGCPGCTGNIGAHADGDELVLLHTEPPCAVYTAFTSVNDVGNEAEDSLVGGGVSTDEALARMIPAWAHGPSTELTEEQGEALLDSGEVLNSCQIMGGMIGATGHARTKDGLFHWSVTVADFDDDDFDDKDEDEVSDGNPPQPERSSC